MFSSQHTHHTHNKDTKKTSLYLFPDVLCNSLQVWQLQLSEFKDSN